MRGRIPVFCYWGLFLNYISCSLLHTGDFMSAELSDDTVCKDTLLSKFQRTAFSFTNDKSGSVAVCLFVTYSPLTVFSLSSSGPSSLFALSSYATCRCWDFCCVYLVRCWILFMTLSCVPTVKRLIKTSISATNTPSLGSILHLLNPSARPSASSAGLVIIQLQGYFLFFQKHNLGGDPDFSVEEETFRLSA